MQALMIEAEGRTRFHARPVPALLPGHVRVEVRHIGVGTPEEIGWACVFLASCAASYVTGQTPVVDGGGLVGF